MKWGRDSRKKQDPILGKYWWAWHPVTLEDGRSVWLEYVWRVIEMHEDKDLLKYNFIRKYYEDESDYEEYERMGKTYWGKKSRFVLDTKATTSHK